MDKRWIGLAIVVALVGVACSEAAPEASGSGSAPSASVAATESSLGRVLTDADGMTLYVFLPDDAGTSTCTGECAATWPPLTADGAPVAGAGVDGAQLGTQPRPDGSEQVAYDGWPLYRYSGDVAPGDVTGQGIGGSWFAMGADGSAIRSTSGDASGYGGGAGSGAAGASGSGGGSGYGGGAGRYGS